MKKILIIIMLVLGFSQSLFGATFVWNPDPPQYINITEDQSFSYDVNVSVNDSLINYDFLKPVQDPDLNGTTKDSDNGIFSAFPSNDNVIDYYGDYYSLTVQATNISSGADFLIDLIYLNILNVNDEPIVNITFPTSNITISELDSQLFTISFYDIDPTNDTLNISWYFNGSLNKSESFSSVDHHNSVTSNVTMFTGYEDEGDYIVTAQIIDNIGGETNYSWNITVLKTDRSPSFDLFYPSNQNVIINESESQLFSANMSDPDGDSINSSWYINGILNKSVNNNYYSTLNFTTNFLSAGYYNITILAWSDTFNISNYWNLTVLNINQPPNISTVIYNSTIHEAEEFELFFNATDLDNNIDSYWITYNGSTISNNNSYYWLTNYSDSGNYTFELWVNDSYGANDTIEINFTIFNNIKPNITSYVNITNGAENVTYEFNFSYFDLNNNTQATRIYFNGNEVSTSNNVSIYFNNSMSGIHNITYFVNDSEGLSDIVSIFININNTNIAPTISTTNYSTSIYEGENLNISFSTYDFDSNIINELIFIDGLIVSSNPYYNSYYNFTQSGVYNVSFFVNDTYGDYDEFNFTLTVINNTYPLIINYTNISSLLEGENFNFSFNYSDSENNIDFMGIYFNNQLKNNSNYFYYSFNQTSSGTYNISYFINDTEGLYDEYNFTLVINDTNFAPSITNWSSNSPVDEGYTLSLNFSAFDIDTNIFGYYVYQEGLLVGNTQNYLWNTTFGDEGYYNFTLFVNDTEGLSDSLNITIVIKNNTAPIIDSYVNVTSGTEGDTIFLGFSASDIELNIDQKLIYVDGFQISSNETNYGFDLDSAGVHNITYFVNDTEGLSDSVEIVINITNTNQRPQIDTVLNNSPINEGEILNISFNATDIDNNIFGYYIFRNQVLVSSNQTTYWQTNFTNSGYHNYTLKVNDTYGAFDEYNLTIFIINNTAPIITNFTNITSDYEGNITYFNFSANDSNDNIQSYKIYLDTILVSNSSNVSIYFNYSSNGVHNITFFVNDTEGLFSNLTHQITIIDVNGPPQINFSSINLMNVSEESYNNITFENNVFDEDNIYSELNWSCIHNESVSNVNISFNNQTKNFSIETYNNFVGFVNVSCFVFDPSLLNDSSNFIIEVIEGNNDLPIITNFTPLNSTLNIIENNYLNFTQNSYDIENYNLSYSWRYDDIEVNTSPNATIYFDYYSKGIANISLFVIDEFGANTSIYWIINISDNNRAPTYGSVIDLFEEHFNFTQTNNSNISNQTISINYNSSNYYNNSYVISNVFSQGLVDYDISINWTETNYINKTNISYLIRTGPTLSVTSSWSEWNKHTLNNFSQKFTSYGSFIQYGINLSTMNSSITPVVEDLKMKILISDKELNKNAQLNNWIDLDDYFFDEDTDNILNYYVYGNSGIDIQINNLTKQVSIIPDTDFYGTETIYFLVDDNTTNVTSNNITITINNIDNSKSSSSSGGGSSSSKKKPDPVIIKEIVEKSLPESIELVLPKPIKAIDNNTIQVPIVIKNTQNVSLENISIFIDKSNKTLNLSLSDFIIPNLEPGETFTLNVTVKNPANLEEFYLNISADEQFFGFKDSGLIFIESLKGENANYSAVQTKLNYAEEFLNQNEDCLELSEHIDKIKNLVSSGDYNDANILADSTIEGCKRILDKDTQIISDDLNLSANEDRKLVIYYMKYFLALILVLLIVPILISIKAYLKNKLKHKPNIKEDLEDYLKKME